MTTRLMAAAVAGGLLLGAAHPAAHDKYRFIGTVSKMDAKKHLLTMKTTDKAYPAVLEVDVTPKTRIERDGQKVPPSDLKAGVHVVVDALGDDYFTAAAVLIRIVPAPPKPASPR